MSFQTKARVWFTVVVLYFAWVVQFAVFCRPNAAQRAACDAGCGDLHGLIRPRSIVFYHKTATCICAYPPVVLDVNGNVK